MAKLTAKKPKGSDVTFDKSQYKEVVITCACGASYKSGSILESIRVDICANCHPFFTGKAKIIDAEGRVERFRKKYNISADK